MSVDLVLKVYESTICQDRETYCKDPPGFCGHELERDEIYKVQDTDKSKHLMREQNARKGIRMCTKNSVKESNKVPAINQLGFIGMMTLPWRNEIHFHAKEEAYSIVTC